MDEAYVTVSLEANEDQPVADIAYREVQWASLRVRGGEGVLTVYATEEGFDVPLPVALSSIEEARRRVG